MYAFRQCFLTMVLGLSATAAAAANAGIGVHNKIIEAKTADYEITAAYPQTGVKSIDDSVAGWVRHEVEQFRNQAAPDPDSSLGAWTLDLDYSIKRNDVGGFALLVSEDTYTGGAHPNHGFTSFNFLMPEGQRVELPEVIDGRPGLRRLSALATADLLQRLATPERGIDPDWIKRGAGPDWANFEVFVLQPTAIEVVFPPYQVASYADGVQEVSIPLHALRTALRRDWRAPAASFNCAKATTPVEHAICANTDLARLDREVAAAYAHKLAEASGPPVRQTIAASQRDWLGDRDSGCRDQHEAGLVTCLMSIYRTRLAELSAGQ